MALIRDGRPEDLPALLELYRALYAQLKGQGLAFELEPAGAERAIEAMLRSKLCFLAVAEEAGKLVGFLCASVVKMDRKLSYEGGNMLGLIHDLYLVPAARRQGLAGRLLELAEEWFRRSGAGAAECQVVQGNTLGQAFWEKRGYAPVSVTRCKRLGAEEGGHVVSAN